jgi:hypothetical protein
MCRNTEKTSRHSRVEQTENAGTQTGGEADTLIGKQRVRKGSATWQMAGRGSKQTD